MSLTRISSNNHVQKYPGKQYKDESDRGNKLSLGDTIESKEWGKGYKCRQTVEESAVAIKIRSGGKEGDLSCLPKQTTPVKKNLIGGISSHGEHSSSDSEMKGSDSDRSLDETKQMDKRETTFVTAASSNVKAKTSKKKTVVENPTNEGETESISIDLLNGAEIAEILELYSIHHVEMKERDE